MEHENSNEQEVIKEKKRPVAITVICIIGFIGTALSFSFIFADYLNQTTSWYTMYLGVSLIIGFTCLLGLWFMKKWAVYTYAGFWVLNQIILVSIGAWALSALVYPAIVVGVAFMHIKKMD